MYIKAHCTVDAAKKLFAHVRWHVATTTMSDPHPDDPAKSVIVAMLPRNGVTLADLADHLRRLDGVTLFPQHTGTVLSDKHVALLGHLNVKKGNTVGDALRHVYAKHYCPEFDPDF